MVLLEILKQVFFTSLRASEGSIKLIKKVQNKVK